MEILNLLNAVTAPDGLWAKLIYWMEGGITNYALIIILLTFCIKFVTLPLDFYNRYSGKKSSLKLAECQPEIDKINKTYANNPNIKNQKTMEVYKRHGYNVYSSCLSVVLFMIVSTTIFFTFFGTLNSMSAYKINEEFNILHNTYNTTYTQYYNSYENDKLLDNSITINQEQYAISKAENAVVVKYGEIKNGFLWIKNIWRPDTGAKVTLTYDKFLKETKQTSEVISEVDYNKVMTPIQTEYNGWNGYFLLTIINTILLILSMYIPEIISKYRAKKKNIPYMKSTNKTMMIIMPLIMALFMIFYNAAFGIYIVAGTVFTLVTMPLMNLLIDLLIEKLNKNNKKDKNKPIYSR